MKVCKRVSRKKKRGFEVNTGKPLLGLIFGDRKEGYLNFTVFGWLL